MIRVLLSMEMIEERVVQMQLKAKYSRVSFLLQ